jgi:heptosyltransferase-2
MKPKKIVIIAVRTYGDFMLMIPFFRELRQRNQEALITVLAGRKGCSVCRELPWIDEVINISFKQGLGSVITQFRSICKIWRADVIYCALPYFLGPILSVLLLGRERIGFEQIYLNLFRGNGEPIHKPELSEWKRYAIKKFLLTKSYVLEYKNRHASTEDLALIPAEPSSVNTLRGSLLEFHPSNSINVETSVVIAPFTGWAGRNWDLDKWRSLVGILIQKLQGIKFIATGQIHDRDQLLSTFECYNNVSVIAETNVKNLFLLIRNSALLISSDSFQVHIASAFNIPTIAFFGPAPPKWFGALAQDSVNIYDALPCSPCYQRRGSNPCLQGFKTCPAIAKINPEDVASLAIKILEKNLVSS